MESLCVVLFHNDPGCTQALATGLSQHFETVCTTRTYQEVRPAISKNHAGALVLDLEKSGPDEVGRLHKEFPCLCIIGTHRLADDKLWAETMSLGASDICEPRSVDVVRSVLNGLAHRRAA
jgi:hypothetical protein